MRYGKEESFLNRLRDELLYLEPFDNVRHTRACIAAWQDAPTIRSTHFVDLGRRNRDRCLSD